MNNIEINNRCLYPPTILAPRIFPIYRKKEVFIRACRYILRGEKEEKKRERRKKGEKNNTAKIWDKNFIRFVT